MSDFKYIPESGLSGSGSNNSLENLFRNSSPGEKNELQVLIREHIQNSLDAFDKRKNKPEKLIFKVSRKKIDSSLFNLGELKSIFEDCRDFREIQFDNDDQKNKDKTFKKLSSSIKNLSKIGNKLWAIIIEDNGCGIDGDSRAPNYTKKTAAQIITEEGDSNKFTNESRGSFGVGKLTVFSNNDTFSVFYSSRNGGKTKFIGKTKLISYTNKNNESGGPNIFFGKATKINDVDYADWADISNTRLETELRSIKDDGLSTIIPSFKSPDTKDNEWINEVSFSIIYSFFKVFENNKMQAEIFDEFSKKNSLLIDFKNYKEIYNASEKLNFIQTSPIDLYNFNLVKPFVNKNQPLFSEKIVKKEIVVTNKWRGNANFYFFNNQNLEDLIDNNSKDKDFNNSKRTFRFLRRGMLLRSEFMPGNGLFDYSFCGYVEFIGEKNPLNELLRVGETESHDSLYKANYKDRDEKDFPAYNTINQKFFSFINKIIQEEVNKLSDQSVNEGDSKIIDLDLFDGFNKDLTNETFSRYIIEPGLYKKLSEKISSGQKNDNSQNENNSEGGVNNNGGGDGIIITIGGSGNKKGKIKTKGGRKSRKRGLVDPGVQDGSRRQELSNIYFLNKIISKKENIHNYKLKLFNVKSSIDILLAQESVSKNTFLSFKISRVVVNGEDVHNYSEKKSNGLITSYIFKNTPPVNNCIDMNLTVVEPNKTEAKFKLIIS